MRTRQRRRVQDALSEDISGCVEGEEMSFDPAAPEMLPTLGDLLFLFGPHPAVLAACVETYDGGDWYRYTFERTGEYVCVHKPSQVL
jgi:hypothetical protein